MQDAKNNPKNNFADHDPTAAERKRDHIELALRSQIAASALDGRFWYEPLQVAHPEEGSYPTFDFLGKTFEYPLWVSSMTGGTAMARTINHNLARACGEFGFGMGLGSCRSLLTSNDALPDFDVRHLIGDNFPLYANLGVAQLEQLIDDHKLSLVNDMVARLRADGLIIHVNPLQEWLQPEGDRFKRPPLHTIEQVLEKTGLKIIVKEVGSGMGPASLEALFKLPIEAVDFAANGGTSFAMIELLRRDELLRDAYGPLANVGHSAAEMVDLSNMVLKQLGTAAQCKQIIVSGGIKNFLDGYHAISKLQVPAIYGQAQGFLQHARGDYFELKKYILTQVRGLELANAYLRAR